MTVNHFDVATPREWTLEVSCVLVRLGVDRGLTWLRYPQRVAGWISTAGEACLLSLGGEIRDTPAAACI